MFVLLVGPKGSGKSHIGRILEKRLGVTFFHVEPLWMNYHAECAAAGRQASIADGIDRVHPKIAQALSQNEHLCVETTGASPEILNDLLSIAGGSNTVVVQVLAPLQLCMERIAARDPTHQIPMDDARIREVYKLSTAAIVEPRLTLDNSVLSDEEIVGAFQTLLAKS